jgi:hypothetical protein
MAKTSALRRSAKVAGLGVAAIVSDKPQALPFPAIIERASFFTTPLQRLETA